MLANLALLCMRASEVLSRQLASGAALLRPAVPRYARPHRSNAIPHRKRHACTHVCRCCCCGSAAGWPARMASITGTPCGAPSTRPASAATGSSSPRASAPSCWSRSSTPRSSTRSPSRSTACATGCSSWTWAWSRAGRTSCASSTRRPRGAPACVHAPVHGARARVAWPCAALPACSHACRPGGPVAPSRSRSPVMVVV